MEKAGLAWGNKKSRRSGWKKYLEIVGFVSMIDGKIRLALYNEKLELASFV